MDKSSLYNKALRLSKQGQYSAAIKEFDKFISQNPRNADVLSDRGVAKYHVKDFAGSLRDFNRALQLEPKNPYRYASRAYIKDCSGDTEGAIEDYKKALQLDPQNAVSHNNLGLLEEKLGFKAMADKRYKLADDLSKKIDSREKQGEKVNQMLSELNISVESVDPFRKSILWQMFRIFLSGDERKEFLTYLKKLLRIK